MSFAQRPAFIHPNEVAPGFESRTFVTHEGYKHELDDRGFRTTNTKRDADLRVLTLGCSFAFGWGLPYDQTFSYHLCSLIERALGVTTSDVNLAVIGASNDYITRQMVEAIEIIAPNIVFIAFTDPARRDYWTGPDRRYTVRPVDPRPEWSEARRKVYNTVRPFENKWNDQQRLYMSIRTCSLAARSVSAAFVYTYATRLQTPQFQEFLNSSEYLGAVFPMLDYADNSKHPGPLSNRLLAIAVLAKLLLTYKIPNGPQRDGPVGKTNAEEVSSEAPAILQPESTWTHRNSIASVTRLPV